MLRMHLSIAIGPLIVKRIAMNIIVAMIGGRQSGDVSC